MGFWNEGVRKFFDCLLWRSRPQGFSLPGGSGAQAEELAGRFLARRGARILARNARFRGGELDLVALHEGCVVFVEVRLRQRQDYGGAGASITPAKQRRLVLAARCWLAGDGRDYRRRPCRFDAVLLSGLDPAGIEWLQGVFDAGGL